MDKKEIVRKATIGSLFFLPVFAFFLGAGIQKQRYESIIKERKASYEELVRLALDKYVSTSNNLIKTNDELITEKSKVLELYAKNLEKSMEYRELSDLVLKTVSEARNLLSNPEIAKELGELVSKDLLYLKKAGLDMESLKAIETISRLSLKSPIQICNTLLEYGKDLGVNELAPEEVKRLTYKLKKAEQVLNMNQQARQHILNKHTEYDFKKRGTKELREKLELLEIDHRTFFEKNGTTTPVPKHGEALAKKKEVQKKENYTRRRNNKIRRI